MIKKNYFLLFYHFGILYSAFLGGGIGERGYGWGVGWACFWGF
jgi:hypothetical protein